MNRTIGFFILACVSACASLSTLAAREERPVSGFHAISMGVVMDLEVVQDGTESLTLEAGPDTLARVETFVHGGTLEFRYKRDTHASNVERVRAVVHARNLDAIALSAAGNVRSASLEADALKLSISGAGDMDIGRVTAKEASLSISGTGHMNLAGATDRLDARISGMGGIKAAKLESQRADVRVSGSGDATVWARQQLAAAISGVGNVRYYGDPALTKRVSGVGHVERIAANP